MIGISSDSTCDLSAQLLQQYDIAITPLHVLVGEQSYLDGVEIDPDRLFAMTEEQKLGVATAAVNVGEYIDFFTARREKYDAIVHFTISSDMSACYQNACIAAAEMTNVYVIDSRNLSTGIGQLVLDAALLARQGVEARDIYAQLNAKKEKLDVSFVVSTLEYLRRGGRCSSVAAMGANLLHLRPCIHVKDGAMGVGKKYRGNMQNVLMSYVQDALAEPESIDTSRLFITYSSMPDGMVDAVEAAVLQCVPFEEVHRTRTGCTVAGHCGPGTLGLLFYRK